jgi:AcrR family transcriptional regulator
MTAPTTDRPSRLERRKARTRAAIIDAAAKLFQDQGYEDTGIIDIAELADTGVGTLYGYFDSKEAILAGVLESRADAAVARYHAAIEGGMDAIDRLAFSLRTLGEYIRENRRLLLAVFAISTRSGRNDEQPTRWLYEVHCRMLETGMEKGEFPRLPVEATARTLIGAYTLAMLGLGLWQGHQDDPRTLDDLEAITRRLLRP